MLVSKLFSEAGLVSMPPTQAPIATRDPRVFTPGAEVETGWIGLLATVDKRLPGRQRRLLASTGTLWRNVNQVAIGRTTPGTATTAACNSAHRLGFLRAAVSTRRKQI